MKRRDFLKAGIGGAFALWGLGDAMLGSDFCGTKPPSGADYPASQLLSDFAMYVGCFKEFNQVGVRNAGAVIGTSALTPGAIRESAAMQEAYETGKNL